MKEDAMDHYSPDTEFIIKYIKELKLPTVKDSLDDIVTDAVAGQWDYRKFLRVLFQREVEQRIENRKYARIRKANFPQMKYLQELNFIREGRNIVMYGNPGTGKTHTAIGLGIKACMDGFTVYFTTVPHLLTQIREAKTNKTVQQLESRFRKYDLVICDEMGYVGFDKEGAELLFNMISTRTGTRATIITTNLPFTRWEEIIRDKVLCSALVDRLCHKAHMVNMTGQSYRVRETQKLLKNL